MDAFRCLGSQSPWLIRVSFSRNDAPYLRHSSARLAISGDAGAWRRIILQIERHDIHRGYLGEATLSRAISTARIMARDFVFDSLNSLCGSESATISRLAGRLSCLSSTGVGSQYSYRDCPRNRHTNGPAVDTAPGRLEFFDDLHGELWAPRLKSQPGKARGERVDSIQFRA